MVRVARDRLRVLEELPLKSRPEAFGGGAVRGRYRQREVEARMCSVAGCGRNGYAVWSACCDDNVQRIFCAEHDVELNWNVLRWTGDPDYERKITTYANDVQERIGRALEVDFLERSA